MNYQKQKTGSVNVRILTAIAGVAIVGGLIYYATSIKPEPQLASVGTPTASTTTQPMMGGEKVMGAGVVLKDGKIMLEMGETMAMEPLSSAYTFENGTRVSFTGQVTQKDRKTFQLKEGQSIWPDGTLMEAGEMMGSSSSMPMRGEMKAGAYEPYDQSKLAMATSGKVVLFFRASWCPTCHALNADIQAHLSDIPANVTILDVDYDHSDALRQKYGITHQHTLVQVDQNGNQIKQWSGSPTLAALLAGIQ